jgi:hypothetical protein
VGTSFGQLADTYNRNNSCFIGGLPPHIVFVKNDSKGNGVFLNRNTGKFLTYDANGMSTDYSPPTQGGKMSRRKANKKRKHFNTSRRIRRR